MPWPPLMTCRTCVSSSSPKLKADGKTGSGYCSWGRRVAVVKDGGAVEEAVPKPLYRGAVDDDDGPRACPAVMSAPPGLNFEMSLPTPPRLFICAFSAMLWCDNPFWARRRRRAITAQVRIRPRPISDRLGMPMPKTSCVVAMPLVEATGVADCASREDVDAGSAVELAVGIAVVVAADEDDDVATAAAVVTRKGPCVSCAWLCCTVIE